MIQILDSMPRKPKFLDQLMGGVEHAGQQLPGILSGLSETQSIAKQFGPDIAALSPELRREHIRTQLAGKNQKQAEKKQALAVGLDTIDQMRSLISSAGPSKYVQSLLGGETTKRRAELETLGRSLIPLVAAGVPIRNQREFEEYRKVITNPNSRQAELEGALNGLQSLFERSIGEEGSSEHLEERSTRKERPPLSSFHR